MSRRRAFRSIVIAVALCSGALLPGELPTGGVMSFCPSARAAEPWLSEMEEICARSNDAMTFSDAELRGLIERCDRLKTRIEALDESTRKVYGRRLLMCRQLYAYVLESRKENEKERK